MPLMRVLTMALVVLAILGLCWSGFSPRLPAHFGHGQIDLSSHSESALHLPQAEVDTAMQQAQAAMFERNRSGARFQQWATGASWFNILCSIIITLVLGWAGKTVAPAQAGDAQHRVGLTPTWARVIGFTAALAGASAYGGNEARQYAEQRYAAAQALYALIAETRRALGGGDEHSQREALQRLQLEAQKP